MFGVPIILSVIASSAGSSCAQTPEPVDTISAGGADETPPLDIVFNDEAERMKMPKLSTTGEKKRGHSTFSLTLST
jgi:hypothetical protein